MHGTDDPDAPAPTAHRWVRRLRITGLALLAVGLFVGGAVVGWVLHDEDPAAVEVVVDRPVNVAGGTAEGTVPDLVGLTAADAQQALLTAGIAGENLSIELTPAAGAQGIVVGQDPAAGATSTGTVVLHVSTPALVPAVVGVAEADANEQLGRLGAELRINRVFDPAAAEGTVLAVDPAVGAPLGGRVTLTIAGPPSSVFLSALDPVEGSCSVGDANVAGTPLPDSLTCSARRDGVEVSYGLNGRVVALEGGFGLENTEGTSPPMRVRIFDQNGTVLVDQTVGFGELRPIATGLGGALRITIEVTLTGPEASLDDPPVGVLAQIRLIGSPADIDALIAESNR
jgi:hypothetical protein